MLRGLYPHLRRLTGRQSTPLDCPAGPGGAGTRTGPPPHLTSSEVAAAGPAADGAQLVTSSTTSMSACSTRATRARTHVSTCIPMADQRPRAALLAQRAIPRLRAAIEASRWPQTRSLRSWVWGAAPSRQGIYRGVEGDCRCHRTGAPCRDGPRGCCALRGRAGAAGLSAYACLAAQQVSDGSHVLQGPAPDYGRREWADSGGKHLGSAHGELRVEKCRGGPGRA